MFSVFHALLGLGVARFRNDELTVFIASEDVQTVVVAFERSFDAFAVDGFIDALRAVVRDFAYLLLRGAVRLYRQLALFVADDDGVAVA